MTELREAMEASTRKSYAEAAQQNKSVRSVLDRSKDLNFKFKEAPKRDELYPFLESVKVNLENVEGIVQLPNGSVDITFKARTQALKADKIIWDLKKEGVSIPHHRLYISEKIPVFLYWVPLAMPDSIISLYFEKRSTPAEDFIQMKDHKGFKNGIRRLFMKREDLENKPLKSYIEIEGFTILTKYRGQQQTCKNCDETGHQRAQCPLLIKTRQQEKLITNVSINQSIKDALPINSDDQINPVLLNSSEEDSLEEQRNQDDTSVRKPKRKLSSNSSEKHPRIRKAISLADPGCSTNCSVCGKILGLMSDSKEAYCCHCNTAFTLLNSCCTSDQTILIESEDINHESSIKCACCNQLAMIARCCNSLINIEDIRPDGICPRCKDPNLASKKKGKNKADQLK